MRDKKYMHDRTQMVAIVYRNPDIPGTEAYGRLAERLEGGGLEVCPVCVSDPSDGVSSALAGKGIGLMVSLGGDGTFLSAARLAAPLGVPVLGANVGRLGFLSENRPDDVAEAILNGDYRIEEYPMLSAAILSGEGGAESFLALNEIAVHRLGAAMLGVEMTVGGRELPTYWSDGLIVASSLGSTAYSLSAGGPIAFPGVPVLLVTPIAPHNLNVRPLIIPVTAPVGLKFRSRDPRLVFSADNQTTEIAGDAEVRVSLAQFSLKRARLRNSHFINALTSKLHWGEDIRNTH